MLPSQRKLLRDNHVQLYRNMEPDPVVFRLRQLGTLTDFQTEEILVKLHKNLKNNAILTLLPKLGPMAFHQFCQALTASGSHHLRILLTPNIPTWKLSDRTQVVLTEKGIAFQCDTKTIHLTLEGYQQLQLISPKIDEALQKLQSIEYYIQPTRKIVVCNILGIMYVVVSERNLVNIDIQLTTKEWIVFTQAANEIHEELSASRPTDSCRHNEYELIEIAYVFLIENFLHKLMQERCPGCAIDACGQLAHMKDGCQTKFSEAIYHHLQEVKGKVTRTLLLDVTTKLLGKLERPESTFFRPFVDIFLKMNTLTSSDVTMSVTRISDFYRDQLSEVLEDMQLF